jgi:hypothetical protein
MFEYCKMILTKISFSPKLFRKEYRKCFRYLNGDQHQELRKWVREKFGKRVPLYVGQERR